MNETFSGVEAFQQNLKDWDTHLVTLCFDFCPQCGLPGFLSCGNNPCGNSQSIMTPDGYVCSLPENDICTLAPSIAPTPQPSPPSLCDLASATANLQVRCITNSTSRGTGTIVSPCSISHKPMLTAPVIPRSSCSRCPSTRSCTRRAKCDKGALEKGSAASGKTLNRRSFFNRAVR